MLADAAAKAIRGLPPYPEAALSVSPEPSSDDLAQLQAVVVRHHSFQALHEVPRDTFLVGARLVGVQHAHACLPERELVKCCLIGFEAREPADVVDKHHVSDTAPGVGAMIQEREEPEATGSVQTAPIIRELLDDLISVLRRPAANLLPLFLDR